jgi:hypothetical protein
LCRYSVVLSASEGGGEVGGHDKTGQPICEIKVGAEHKLNAADPHLETAR